MHFITTAFFPAAEDIYIVTGFRTGSDDTHHTGLVGTAFRFTERNIAIGYGSESFSRFGRNWKTGFKIEGVITFHNRITGNAIYANRVMTGKLRVIFQIVQSAV